MPCANQYDVDGYPYVLKDPEAVLDYKVDLAPYTNGRCGCEADWLQDGETVIDHTVTAGTGVTVDSSSITDSGTSITIWLSGGSVGVESVTVYDIALHFVTSAGREDDRTFRVWMVDR